MSTYSNFCKEEAYSSNYSNNTICTYTLSIFNT